MTRRLSSLDDLFLKLETPATPMHVAALLVFEGDGVDAPERLARLRGADVRTGPFDWRLRQSGLPGWPPSWETVDGVDVAAHVGVRRVDRPGGPSEVMAAVSSLYGGPLGRDRPLWECHLLDGLEGGRYGYYYKVHHAAIDGMTAIRRMQQGLQTAPSDEPTPPLWQHVPPPRASRPPRPPRGVGSILAAPYRAARVAAEIAGMMGRLAPSGARPPYRAVAPFTAPPSTILNRPTTSGGRRIAWTRLPLARVRAVGRAAGATVNEVFLALLAGVLRDWLLARRALPRRPLVAMVPVSLRRDGEGEGGVDATAILCNLATHLGDRRARLDAITASSKHGKRLVHDLSHEAAFLWAMVAMTPAIVAMQLGVYAHTPLPFNVVVSNVPGPRAPLFDGRSRLEAIYPVSMLWDRQALNVTLMGCGDDLCVGLVATLEPIRDLEAVARAIRDELDALEAAVG